jgi:alkylated DNA repair dioxygenase AlkB
VSGPDAETAWLAADPVIERIALDATSWVEVVRAIVPCADEVHDRLVEDLPWEQGAVFRYERDVDLPRMGTRRPGRTAHPALAQLGSWLDTHYRVPFDAGGIARYRDGRDSMGWHRDREMKWLDETLIGIVTLGAQRPFVLRPVGERRYVDDDWSDVVDLSPAGGDLVVLGGRCQVGWLHAVPKVRGAVGDRISVQFRWTSKRGRPDTNPSFYAARQFGKGPRPGPRR